MNLVDNDDSHLCLKCQATIIGLDNYVSHRKKGCHYRSGRSGTETCIVTGGKGAVEPSPVNRNLAFEEESLVHSLIDPHALSVGADATSASALPSAAGCDSGVTTTDGVQQQVTPADTPKNANDFQSTADDFFLSLELQSSVKKTKTKEGTRSRTRKAEKQQRKQSIGVDLDFVADNTINIDVETTPPLRVEHDVFPVECPAIVSANPASTVASPYHVLLNAPFAGGKWSSDLFSTSFSESFTSETTFQPPRPSYTGGKWKPEGFGDNSPLHNMLPDDTSWLFQPDDQSNVPSKPAEIQVTDTAVLLATPVSTTVNTSTTTTIASPCSTRGKWMPGNKSQMLKSGSGIQYFCKPCNRLLAGKTSYERHILSELHFKRTGQEDWVNLDCGGNTPKRIPRKKKSIGSPHHVIATKRKRQCNTNKATKSDANDENETRCDVCLARVQKHLMGKHLISHFHCSRAIGVPGANNMILENIHDIVKQAPFQCSLCRFYCVSMDQFMLHWNSPGHVRMDATYGGVYECTTCKRTFQTTEQMGEHLKSLNHADMVAIINKSLPIVIWKLQTLSCPECEQKFRYNIQLQQHVRKDHDNPLYLAPGQERLTCSMCPFVTMSQMSLVRHCSIMHKQECPDVFYCSLCDLHFDTAIEARKHRSSADHRYRLEVAAGKNRRRRCAFCNDIFSGVPELKLHVLTQHQHCAPRCDGCGKTFALTQELNKHTSSGKCPQNKLPQVNCTPVPAEGSPPAPNASDSVSLSRCTYLGCSYAFQNSKAEWYHHQALHEPARIAKNKSSLRPGATTNPCTYACPLCKKHFGNIPLLAHLRRHFKERLYPCIVCQSKFSSFVDLRVHQRNVHSKKTAQQKTLKCDKCDFTTYDARRLKRHSSTHERKQSYLCDTCGNSYANKHSLHYHQKLHLGKSVKCTFEGCLFACRSKGELETHMVTHTNVRAFKCESEGCNYAAKTKSQLKRHQIMHKNPRVHPCPECNFVAQTRNHIRRHMLIHSDNKSFKCPHCSYTCNLIENLRKHVLTTRKHVGKFLYNCPHCPKSTGPFATNSAAQFITHLKKTHGFSGGSTIASHVTGLFTNNSTSTSPSTVTTTTDPDTIVMYCDNNDLPTADVVTEVQTPEEMPASSSVLQNDLVPFQHIELVGALLDDNTVPNNQQYYCMYQLNDCD